MSYYYLPFANEENKIKEVTHSFKRIIGCQPHAMPSSRHTGYKNAQQTSGAHGTCILEKTTDSKLINSVECPVVTNAVET